ncbi:MAG: GNAT family N-acetyltransferase [Anaerolineae bacterium]|nr:GNAT family N-acetyltransferase [Anaerolineae bacterium]
MKIRVAVPEDADAIGVLWLELVAYHRDLDEHMPEAAKDGAYRYAQRIRWMLDDDTHRTLVAEQDGELVGYALGMVIDLLPDVFKAERAGMVADVFVRADWRGQGVGTAIMHAMRDWFVLRGVTHYELYVAAVNDQGRRFWERTMGGVPVMLRMRMPVEVEE